MGRKNTAYLINTYIIRLPNTIMQQKGFETTSLWQSPKDFLKMYVCISAANVTHTKCSSIMTQWLYVIYSRVPHFSKAAHPITVPKTETGKIYLLMTPE